MHDGNQKLPDIFFAGKKDKKNQDIGIKIDCDVTFSISREKMKPSAWKSCRLLPFQAEDAVENAALSVSALQDKHTAQDIEVQLVLRHRTHHSGLEEGGPLPLQGPLASPVILHTEETTDVWMDGLLNQL